MKKKKKGFEKKKRFKMKIKVLAIVALILVGIGFVWWLIGQQTGYKGTEPHLQSSSKKIPQYVCPMHPQIRSDKSGSCPICGMDLVLVESVKGEHEDFNHKENVKEHTPIGHTHFNLSLRKQQMIGVKIGKAQKKKLFKSIRAPGRIAFDPELYTAQSEYLEALKQWNSVKNSPISGVKESTRQMIRSSKIRLKILGLSEGQIKTLAKKGSQSEGLLVSGQGQENWVYADVFEVDLPYIKKGLSAQVKANFLQGKTLSGQVLSVDQIINPETRTAKVRIKLLKNNPSIRLESYVNVTIFAPLGEHISVPLEALMDTGRETFIFVRKGQGQFEPRRVSVFLETDEDAALKSGEVKVGEEIVIGGNFMLDSESRLKAVIEGVLNSSAE